MSIVQRINKYQELGIIIKLGHDDQLDLDASKGVITKEHKDWCGCKNLEKIPAIEAWIITDDE